MRLHDRAGAPVRPRFPRPVVFLSLLAFLLGVPAGAARAGDPAPEEGKTSPRHDRAAEGKEQAKPAGNPPLVEEVVVTATRAAEDRPATWSNLSREQVRERHGAEDVPVMLRDLPSVYAWSDAGNGVGYSYLSLRGFYQRRVTVTLNGIPLNDIESHQVWWIDLPDLAASLEDVQVQRGAGTSIGVPAPIGGAIDLETARLRPGEGPVAAAGTGSHGTSRATAAWTSELLPGDWVLGARVSRVATDGYRKQAWSRMGMGFFTVQRLRKDSLLRINVYGGREESHLAYDGVPREVLRRDRRANPLTWPGEKDHFSQPHYELLHEWRPRDDLEIANTLFYFAGTGYYRQFRERKAFYEVRLPDWDWDGDGTVDEKGPIYRRRQVEEWDAGWIPRVTWRRGAHRLSAGVTFRRHRGRHVGTARGAVPPGIGKPYRYYDYRVPKTRRVAWVQDEWSPRPGLHLVAGLQRVTASWKLEDDRVTGYRYDVDYGWWAPRVAASWRAGGGTTLFASISRSGREPAVKDLYDPQDVYSSPAFRVVRPDGSLAGPLPRHERLTDYELGAEWKGPRHLVRVTLYDMEFRDEIVYLGRFNDLGAPVTGNADRSRHRGLELEGAVAVAPRVEVRGNLSLTDDELVRFRALAWDDAAGDFVVRDYSGNRPAFFPEWLANLRVAWTPAWGRVELGAFHAGRLFLDNSESRERSVDPWTVVHLAARWDLARTRDRVLSLRLRIDNLLDEEYETFGYVDWDGTPLYLPGADRTWFVSLGWEPGGRDG